MSCILSKLEATNFSIYHNELYFYGGETACCVIDQYKNILIHEESSVFISLLISAISSLYTNIRNIPSYEWLGFAEFRVVKLL
jgi:hypothetical protein